MKRVMDFLFSTVGLFILSPLLIIFFLIVKFTSRGPGFFLQERVGRNGDIFKIIKFRTMFVVKESNSTISLKGDVRVTEVGVFLRKYKLDELPSLLNVVLGHMSLVGPRPDVPGYADVLEGKDKDILKLRPGITGPASLKYSNEEEILASKKDPKYYNDNVIYPDKVKINLDYYNNQTIWLDIKIIFATILKSFFT